MRNIKFRGKRLDNGEWVYGNYFIDERDIEDGFIWHNGSLRKHIPGTTFA